MPFLYFVFWVVFFAGFFRCFAGQLHTCQALFKSHKRYSLTTQFEGRPGSLPTCLPSTQFSFISFLESYRLQQHHSCHRCHLANITFGSLHFTHLQSTLHVTYIVRPRLSRQHSTLKNELGLWYGLVNDYSTENGRGGYLKVWLKSTD